MVLTRTGLNTSLNCKQSCDKFMELTDINPSLDYESQVPNVIEALSTSYQITRLSPQSECFMKTFKRKLIDLSTRKDIRENPTYQRIMRQVFNREIYE